MSLPPTSLSAAGADAVADLPKAELAEFPLPRAASNAPPGRRTEDAADLAPAWRGTGPFIDLGDGSWACVMSGLNFSVFGG